MRLEPVVLSLGSNQGDRLGFLRTAVDMLRTSGVLHQITCSSVYESEPVGYVDQPAFLNMAVAGKCSVAPKALLEVCWSIEAACNRRREVRWGPRTLDIDIITYGDLTQADPELTLPHPRACERAFVLIPMLEIDPRAKLGNRSARECLEALEEEQGVVRYAPSEAILGGD